MTFSDTLKESFDGTFYILWTLSDKRVHRIGEGFKNPSNGNFPLRGYPPPPPPLSGLQLAKKLAEIS